MKVIIEDNYKSKEYENVRKCETRKDTVVIVKEDTEQILPDAEIKEVHNCNELKFSCDGTIRERDVQLIRVGSETDGLYIEYNETSETIPCQNHTIIEAK